MRNTFREEVSVPCMSIPFHQCESEKVSDTEVTTGRKRGPPKKRKEIATKKMAQRVEAVKSAICWALSFSSTVGHMLSAYFYVGSQGIVLLPEA